MSESDNHDDDDDDDEKKNDKASADNNDQGKESTRRRRRLHHYQVGAPSLIYYANRQVDQQFSPYRVPSSDLPLESARTWQDVWNRKNRVRARWEHPSLGLDQVQEVQLPFDVRRGRANRKVAAPPPREQEGTTTTATEETLDSVNEQTKARMTLLLLQEDYTLVEQHKELVENYRSYERPYQDVKMSFRDDKHRRAKQSLPRLRPVDYCKSQEFRLQHELQSDPAYLAPLDWEGLKEATGENELQRFRKRVQGDAPPRMPQGNTLLACQCPCPPCSRFDNNNNPSIVLIHPKGPLMERLCVSNVIPPFGRRNTGHVRANVNELKYHSWEVYETFPNEIDLDDTILEIRQSGVWNGENPSCLLTVRTGTHVSFVTIHCQRPDFHDRYDFEDDETLCWGCYVFEEKERLDFRSISRKMPSLQPMSLVSHPNYGNPFVPSKVAMACHSIGNYDTQNVIYSCNTFNGDHVSSRRHDITNLRKISLLDYTAHHPMCLWSAASSYVRPALAAGVVAQLTRQTKGAFGLGTSLYTIDLRSNTATFQWSPSAEEMMTEGVHSISGIMTDWKSDTSVWATSTSAGKTWEVDGRMPAKAVTCWSLTSGCEGHHHTVVPRHGFHGENSLLVPTLDFVPSTNDKNREGSPFVKVHTDYGATGIHMYQRPLRQPRFQAESLEAVATPGIDFTEHSSIAASTYFALPDVQSDSYICGIASLRVPFESFFGDEMVTDDYGRSPALLCNLTINNHCDIFSHSIIENTGGLIEGSVHRFDDLPVGTKAISVPKYLDGRTIHLTSSHQKPTCGMNLRLFLSNQYPLSRNSLVLQGDANGSKNDVLVPISKKLKIDDTDVAEFKVAQPQGLVINSSVEGHRMLQDGESLKIPASLTKQARTPIKLYQKDDHDTDSDDSLAGRRSRSDLSSLDIKDALQSWNEGIGDDGGS
jgi:hypothetical protein